MASHRAAPGSTPTRLSPAAPLPRRRSLSRPRHTLGGRLGTDPRGSVSRAYPLAVSGLARRWSRKTSPWSQRSSGISTTCKLWVRESDPRRQARRRALGRGWGSPPSKSTRDPLKSDCKSRPSRSLAPTVRSMTGFASNPGTAVLPPPAIWPVPEIAKRPRGSSVRGKEGGPLEVVRAHAYRLSHCAAGSPIGLFATDSTRPAPVRHPPYNSLRFRGD